MLEAVELKSVQHKGKSKETQYKNEVLRDFWICCVSREVSILGRKEVLTGKAKFGILGDGKEVPQVAMARAFNKGDYRSGYYRDQTFMFALGLCTVEEYFAQLYADPKHDPFSGGRQMNAHFSTPFLDDQEEWLDLTKRFNVTADVSSTGGQMARALGVAFASKLYRESKVLEDVKGFSNNGNEVSFCTIGDASTSEGVFWETMNAAGVLQVPLAVSVWDDGYGISVPIDLQTTKKSISAALSGLQQDEGGEGIQIYTGRAWNYPELVALYESGIGQVRKYGRPALFHIKEVTQPQGHSTSGSHERYKDEERLKWEEEKDCITAMGQWMIEHGIASEEQIEDIKAKAKAHAKEGKERAWKAFYTPVKDLISVLNNVFDDLEGKGYKELVEPGKKELKEAFNPLWNDVVQIARRTLLKASGSDPDDFSELRSLVDHQYEHAEEFYHTHLYSNSAHAALNVPVVEKQFSEDSKKINGYQVLNRFFDKKLEEMPELLAFGEDVGQIGDVNQGFAGLQEKYGKNRVFDTGIREWTIMGQAIGTALRGLRPIAEIQYLDYLIFGLEPLTDDLATLRYRSDGTQKAPAIIRTRGHRLEGIWHAGSPLGMLIHAVRGMYVAVPRDMVQAAGIYNTLLRSDDPAIVIECLNGYRLKEKCPDNLGEYTVPLGVPEVLISGEDITLVTYGSCVRIAEEACHDLEEMGISVELIDVQTLLPFDLEEVILSSLKKTNRIVFLDEDVPGGATSYMLQEVLEKQGGYRYLDSEPTTITAKAHRPPYGSDGDYFSKPNREDIFEVIYKIMHEAHPDEFEMSF
ncbi:MAG: thiamine pyrophosphate-dependent enzyme [Saprospiraceae bacterium]|nr:thiamine pyrophosphate-dependent enzyme [Saprospiraceae bacterium]